MAEEQTLCHSWEPPENIDAGPEASPFTSMFATTIPATPADQEQWNPEFKLPDELMPHSLGAVDLRIREGDWRDMVPNSGRDPSVVIVEQEECKSKGWQLIWGFDLTPMARPQMWKTPKNLDAPRSVLCEMRKR